MTPEEAFDIAYGSLASSDASMACTMCNHTLVGDGPTEPCVCIPCLAKFNLGVCYADRVVCFECAALEDARFHEGTPVTSDSHPDGFTCDICGDVTVSVDSDNVSKRIPFPAFVSLDDPSYRGMMMNLPNGVIVSIRWGDMTLSDGGQTTAEIAAFNAATGEFVYVDEFEYDDEGDAPGWRIANATPAEVVRFLSNASNITL